MVTEGNGTVLTTMGNGTGSWRHNRVAGPGIEPGSGGYAYHYNFHCPIVCGLDYAFTRMGCLPSSLYTFLATGETWLGIAVRPKTRGFHRIWQIILCAIAHAHARIVQASRGTSPLPRYVSSSLMTAIRKYTHKNMHSNILYGTCVYILYIHIKLVSFTE